MDSWGREALPSPTSARSLGRRCDSGLMTTWQYVERAEPEFAQRVRGLFDMRRHKTIATLRADGSPRISGIEAAFEDGELVFGSMLNARKGADLRRDPRFALHSATVDPVEGSEAWWPGEAKISGRAIYAGPTTEAPDGDRFAPTLLRSAARLTGSHQARHHRHRGVRAIRMHAEKGLPERRRTHSIAARSAHNHRRTDPCCGVRSVRLPQRVRAVPQFARSRSVAPQPEKPLVKEARGLPMLRSGGPNVSA